MQSKDCRRSQSGPLVLITTKKSSAENGSPNRVGRDDLSNKFAGKRKHVLPRGSRLCFPTPLRSHPSLGFVRTESFILRAEDPDTPFSRLDAYAFFVANELLFQLALYYKYLMRVELVVARSLQQKFQPAVTTSGLSGDPAETIGHLAMAFSCANTRTGPATTLSTNDYTLAAEPHRA